MADKQPSYMDFDIFPIHLPATLVGVEVHNDSGQSARYEYRLDEGAWTPLVAGTIDNPGEAVMIRAGQGRADLDSVEPTSAKTFEAHIRSKLKQPTLFSIRITLDSAAEPTIVQRTIRLGDRVLLHVQAGGAQLTGVE